jgi:hypothetical protein
LNANENSKVYLYNSVGFARTQSFNVQRLAESHALLCELLRDGAADDDGPVGLQGQKLLGFVNYCARLKKKRVSL